MVIFEDRNGNSVRIQYKVVNSRITEQRSDILDKPKNSVVQFFQSAFLPEGYPDSVSEDYLEYQKWDSTQALCSSVTGLLATQAILKGVGVGDAAATTTSAVIQWIIRDGTGMIGRIIFAWFQGTNLDCNAKTWRLMADILNDLGIMTEILSPLFSSYFLFVACIGSLFKAMVGVAGGATRAALAQHQARRNNMADVSAKDGSQETAVNLIGMVLGLVLTPLLGGDQYAIWGLFLLFTFLHLFSNYRAVSCVILDTLNQQRYSILLDRYSDTSTVMSPKEVSSKEKIFYVNKDRIRMKFGAQIVQLTRDGDAILKILQVFRNENYLMSFDTSGELVVVFNTDAESHDVMKSFFHSYVVKKAVKGMKTPNNLEIIEQTLKKVNIEWPALLQQLESKKWVTQHNLLGARAWRSVWALQESVKGK